MQYKRDSDSRDYVATVETTKKILFLLVQKQNASQSAKSELVGCITSLSYQPGSLFFNHCILSSMRTSKILYPINFVSRTIEIFLAIYVYFSCILTVLFDFST